MERYDVAVVGGGTSGLTALRATLEPWKTGCFA